jgi:hypothetical protein
MSRIAEVNPEWPTGGADGARSNLTYLRLPPDPAGNALVSLRNAPYGIVLRMPGGDEIEQGILAWMETEPGARQNGQDIVMFSGAYPSP